VRQWLSPKKLTEALALFTSLFFFLRKKNKKNKAVHHYIEYDNRDQGKSS
jgi:hypothetical protein